MDSIYEAMVTSMLSYFFRGYDLCVNSVSFIPSFPNPYICGVLYLIPKSAERAIVSFLSLFLEAYPFVTLMFPGRLIKIQYWQATSPNMN